MKAGLGLCGLCIIFGGILPTRTPIVSLTHAPHLTQVVSLDAAKKYEVPAVNARVDRVWHGIPGLNGWKLDEFETRMKTKNNADGKVHAVWTKVSPRTSLAALPPEPIYRGPSAEKSACLMFNVSWGEQFVPGILKTLRQKHVRATFFLDGTWVRLYPELAKEIKKEGHVIGSHGTSHPDFSKLSDGMLERQVIGTNQTILHTLGVKPTLLAPPAGAYDDRTVRIAHRNGMHTILWTTDTIDWRKPPASVILSRVTNGIEPGSLILMHPTKPTEAALPALIDSIRKKGYQLKTVDDVVGEKRLNPPSVLE